MRFDGDTTIYTKMLGCTSLCNRHLFLSARAAFLTRAHAPSTKYIVFHIISAP